jgi:hypothetical protein
MRSIGSAAEPPKNQCSAFHFYIFYCIGCRCRNDFVKPASGGHYVAMYWKNGQPVIL